MPNFISHKYKFIFVSTLKCANTSTIKMLYDSKERKYIFPNNQVRMEKRSSTKEQIFQSPFNYYEENGKKNNSYRTLMWYKEKYPKCFDSYLKIGMCRNPYDRLISWLFACKELNFPEGNKSIKDLNIHTNVKKECLKKNNIDPKKIEKKHYSYYYDDKLIELLHSFVDHKKDIDYFGYKFERKVQPGKQPLYAFNMKQKLILN